MKKKSLKIIIVVVLIAVSGLLYGYYGFLYKPSRDIAQEASVYTLNAGEMVKEYTANMQNADVKYLNNTLDIKGKVTEIRDSLIILDNSVVCGFDAKPIRLLVGDNIAVKGRCIGFDELFGEVKLDQCAIKQ